MPTDLVVVGRVGRPHGVDGAFVVEGASEDPRRFAPPLEEGSYYVADLVGLDVLDADGSRVGSVRDVLPGPANDALELDTGLLLPLVEDCVREVDPAGGRIILNPGFTD